MLESSKSRQRRNALIVMAVVGSIALRANGQQSRTRELTYDLERKEWVELPPPPSGTPDGDLYRIKAQLRKGRYRHALSAIKRFVKDHGETAPQFPAVLIAKAEALIGRREYYKAYGVVQQFLSKYAGMALTSDALRLKFVIAETFLSGVKRKLLGLRLLPGEDLAYRILDEIAVDYPDSKWAVFAIKTKADHLFLNGDHSLSELEYARLIKEHPRSRYHRPALRRIADAALASFRGIEYDEAALIEADERYREYIGHYPHTGDTRDIELLLDGISEQRAEKEFSIGRYYERTRHISSALFYYRSVMSGWPESVAAAKAGERLSLLGAE
ncbi:MAG: outer membrane protein assembly factor BamD [Phycisphaerae bacterium]